MVHSEISRRRNGFKSERNSEGEWTVVSVFGVGTVNEIRERARRNNACILLVEC